MKIIKAGYEIIKDKSGMDILKNIEKIGRVCYKSEDRITDDSCISFVKGLIQRGHEAMIEHEKITVVFTNDRGVSHEEVRHRLASFAQESTRYCNYSKDKFGNEVTFIDISKGIELDNAMQKSLESGNLTTEDISAIINEWKLACEDAEKHYFNMLQLGASPNIARSVLNNSTKTTIVITMNIREWRHFFKLRIESVAHPQMREVTIPLLKEMQETYPVLFDDIELK